MIFRDRDCSSWRTNESGTLRRKRIGFMLLKAGILAALYIRCQLLVLSCPRLQIPELPRASSLRKQHVFLVKRGSIGALWSERQYQHASDQTTIYVTNRHITIRPCLGLPEKLTHHRTLNPCSRKPSYEVRRCVLNSSLLLPWSIRSKRLMSERAVSDVPQTLNNRA